MSILARPCEIQDILPLRGQYREEMQCQITHDSIHARPGWTREYLLEVDNVAAGYGSVAVAGPWTNIPTLYEFYVEENSRQRVFDLFAALRVACAASRIETQTNVLFLPIMLHTFGQNIQAEAILFQDQFQTSLHPEGASVRPREAGDDEQLRALELDNTAGWVVVWNGMVAGAGGILYHYNRPYGDIYMKIAEPFQRKGLGAYLVQELKRICRDSDSVPAARCNIDNLASQKTLQKAGFVPCANRITADLPPLLS